MRKHDAGYALPELLAALMLLGVVLAGVTASFALHNRTQSQQRLAVATQQDLRMAMGVLTDTLRSAGYGVPTTSLAAWVPWVASFTTNPTITSGGSSPDAIAIAGSFGPAVAQLAADAAQGATTLSITMTNTGELDTGTRRLIQIGGAENAHVVTVGTNTITIDTNPTAASDQGLKRAHPAGTIIRRVDVVSFDVVTDTTTGVPYLRRDKNQGAGPQAVVEGIQGLQIATINLGRQYQMTLTARAAHADPITGSPLVRSLRTDVAVRN